MLDAGHNRHSPVAEIAVRRVSAIFDLQAIYYGLSGAWPLVAYASFERVLGPKVDDWLVYLIGMLAIVIGIGLLARPRSRPGPQTYVLAAGAALSFGIIDVVYVTAARIAPIYLFDAAAEVVFVAAAVWGWVADSPRVAGDPAPPR